MSRAFAVFLNYNGLRHLNYCLPTFEKASRKAGGVKAIVVDSGSTDGSQEFLRRNYPAIKLLQLPDNLGWAGGNNAGIAYALAHGADYVFVLNTDLKLHENFFTAIMQAGGKNKSYGIFGCKIYFMGSRTLQAAGGNFFTSDNMLGAKQIGDGEVDKGQHNKLVELDYIYEPAFAVKREVFEKAGLLDPAWFILMEGPDYCVRARRAGFKTVYVPGAAVEHEVSGTTNRKKNKHAGTKFFLQILFAGARNGLRFMLKHRTFSEAIKYQARAFADALRKLLSHPHLLPLQFYSVLWNLVHLPQTLALKGAHRENYEDYYKKVLSKS